MGVCPRNFSVPHRKAAVLAGNHLHKMGQGSIANITGHIITCPPCIQMIFPPRPPFIVDVPIFVPMVFPLRPPILWSFSCRWPVAVCRHLLQDNNAECQPSDPFYQPLGSKKYTSWWVNIYYITIYYTILYIITQFIYVVYHYISSCIIIVLLFFLFAFSVITIMIIVSLHYYIWYVGIVLNYCYKLCIVEYHTF